MVRGSLNRRIVQVVKEHQPILANDVAKKIAIEDRFEDYSVSKIKSAIWELVADHDIVPGSKWELSIPDEVEESA